MRLQFNLNFHWGFVTTENCQKPQNSSFAMVRWFRAWVAPPCQPKVSSSMTHSFYHIQGHEKSLQKVGRHRCSPLLTRNWFQASHQRTLQRNTSKLGKEEPPCANAQLWRALVQALEHLELLADINPSTSKVPHLNRAGLLLESHMEHNGAIDLQYIIIMLYLLSYHRYF